MEFRNYQKEAINRTLEEYNKGNKNFFLKMATGSGKTLTSCGIIKEILEINPVAKILFLAPRSSLVEQTMESMDKDEIFNGKSLQSYKELSISKNLNKTSQLNVSTIQRIGKSLKKFNKSDFDVIIFDEAHIGLQSKEIGLFKKVFYYFESATKIGLTATPRNIEVNGQIKNTFGDMIYELGIKEGIENGFLSPPGKIVSVKEINGKKITNKNLSHQNSIESEAASIYSYLKDSKYKSIIFCSEDIKHADPLSLELQKYFKNGEVVKVTSESNITCNNFKSSVKNKVAVTADLLTMGVDIPEVKNIVLCRNTKSEILLEQIIGRAIRLIDGTPIKWNIFDFGDNSILIQKILDRINYESEEKTKIEFHSVNTKVVVSKEEDFNKKNTKQKKIEGLEFELSSIQIIKELKGEYKMNKDKITEGMDLILTSVKEGTLENVAEKTAENTSSKPAIYVLSNPSMPDQIKIGFTGRTVEERAKELYNTSVATPFIIEYTYGTDTFEEAKNLEKELHDFFDDRRVTDNREFFIGVTSKEVQEYIELKRESEIEGLLRSKDNLITALRAELEAGKAELEAGKIELSKQKEELENLAKPEGLMSRLSSMLKN